MPNTGNPCNSPWLQGPRLHYKQGRRAAECISAQHGGGSGRIEDKETGQRTAVPRPTQFLLMHRDRKHNAPPYKRRRLCCLFPAYNYGTTPVIHTPLEVWLKCSPHQGRSQGPPPHGRRVQHAMAACGRSTAPAAASTRTTVSVNSKKYKLRTRLAAHSSCHSHTP